MTDHDFVGSLRTRRDGSWLALLASFALVACEAREQVKPEVARPTSAEVATSSAPVERNAAAVRTAEPSRNENSAAAAPAAVPSRNENSAAAAAPAAEQAAASTHGAAPAANAKPGSASASASADVVAKRITDTSQVCMVNNQFMGRPQIPVEVEGRTYYGCCEMCKGRLARDPQARVATDPVSKNSVDKSKAVIAQLGNGSVVYFENEANFDSYVSQRGAL